MLNGDRPRTESRVWIIEPDSIFRSGLTTLLRAHHYDVVAESDALSQTGSEQNVDVVMFDVGAVRLDEALTLRAASGARLVAIVGSVDGAALEWVTEGVEGVLLRSELTPQRILGCLAGVTEGLAALPLHVLMQAVGNGRHDAASGFPGTLLPRELHVLELLAEGKTTRDIAAKLSYSERTVKNIVHDLLIKLGSRTRAHAVALAIRQHLM